MTSFYASLSDASFRNFSYRAFTFPINFEQMLQFFTLNPILLSSIVSAGSKAEIAIRRDNERINFCRKFER
jgi:hypothetical protein